MMNRSFSSSILPALRITGLRTAHYLPSRKTLGMLTVMAFALTIDHAFAQAANGSSNGIGSQVQGMSQEGLTTTGFVASMVMYGASFICLIGGAWALWQSRNEQNRSPGKIGMGVAGLILCGLFATGPQWINKSANTASGGQATVGTQAQAYQFTGGN
ncbi:hypothetical protein [Kozakia baliensis]|uniref:hypothetical protein n=1 Tax=Kozakia baliensis TaxID=153496 RepID=UPI001D03899F|nr:hypothetical protein [Kozakia baliensis]